MRLPFIHRTGEGEVCHNGLNWEYDTYVTRLRLVLRLWRLFLYFRWRSPNVGGARFIFDVAWASRYSMGRITYEFDTHSLSVGGVRISCEALWDIAHPDPEAWFRFYKEGDMLLVERATDPRKGSYRRYDDD